MISKFRCFHVFFPLEELPGYGRLNSWKWCSQHLSASLSFDIAWMWYEMISLYWMTFPTLRQSTQWKEMNITHTHMSHRKNLGRRLVYGISWICWTHEGSNGTFPNSRCPLKQIQGYVVVLLITSLISTLEIPKLQFITYTYVIICVYIYIYHLDSFSSFLQAIPPKFTAHHYRTKVW